MLIGKGNGAFKPAVAFTVGLAPVSLRVADFNLDGKRDIVVANRGSDNISVLIGNGNGTFKPARHFDAGQRPSSVVTGTSTATAESMSR